MERKKEYALRFLTENWGIERSAKIKDGIKEVKRVTKYGGRKAQRNARGGVRNVIME